MGLISVHGIHEHIHDADSSYNLKTGDRNYLMNGFLEKLPHEEGKLPHMNYCSKGD